MPTCSVRQCRSAEIFDDPECEALLGEYADECGNALMGRARPSRDHYAILENTGMAQCFAARHDGRLCGFAMLLSTVLPHYGIRSATVESLFVARAARHLGLGTELMEAIDSEAKRRGAETIFYTAPVNSRLDLLLTLRPVAYHLTNHVFTRRLT